ncbi:MAG: glucosaminidase domain-containing protein [Gammaproteobacteria bacterium]|nr:glucosaminidase domain-containing protein [Gammaproteobacteria bacterium]
MKFGITIVVLFLSGIVWSADAPLNNYYNNGYYQNSYYQAPDYQAYSYYPQEYSYQQGYYSAPAYPVQNQNSYYTPPAYQPPVYYAPVYAPPTYQDPYTYSNGYQQPAQTYAPTNNINKKAKSTATNAPKKKKAKAISKPIVKPIIKTEDKAKQTVKLPAKTSKKLSQTGSQTEKRKQFLKQILPLVNNANRQIQENRNRLLSIFSEIKQKQSISSNKKIWLKQIARKYRISGSIVSNADKQQELLKRVNTIPPAMALAQAANESAWGTSRFSKQGNNLFGIWTYNEKIGIKPLRREPGKKHFVRKFSSFQESVTVYIHTLNSHPAYKKLRDIRHQALSEGKKLSGFELANGLEKYSAKGQDYIKMIQAMINSYDLENIALTSLNHDNLS